MTSNTDTTPTASPWIKPTKSGNGGNGCANWRWLPGGGMELRNDTNPDGGTVVLTPFETECFLDAISNGEIVRPAEYEA
jgi:hypothetical protein